MDGERLIVIGASEGGVQAVSALLGALPGDFGAPILVVVHIGAHRSELPALLNLNGTLRAAHPSDGEPIRAGHIYVAPPDYHMLVDGRAVRLTKGPRENFARPSIDPLFRSAAEAYGPAAIGVILTGGLNDGVAGLFEIKRSGGTAIAQDPDGAINPSMPRNALAYVAVDHCMPLALMPALLIRLAAEKRPALVNHQHASEELETDMSAHFTLDLPAAVTCPDCGGALRESRLGALTKFRCHIGHAYTAEAMLAGQFKAMEQSLEAALRALNERAELCRQMARRSPAQSPPLAIEAWLDAEKDATDQALALRTLLEHDWLHPSV